VSVTMYDNASHTNTAIEVNAVFIDTTSPALTISSPQEGQIYNTGNVNLNVSADKSIDIWMYNINGTGNVTFPSNVTISNLPDGAHNITVFANDSMGNMGSAMVNFTIDTTPPAAPEIDVPANGGTLASANTWVNGTADTDAVNVTVYVNGSITNASVAVSGNTFNISNVPLGADGPHEINVSAMDAAGNVNTTNASVTVTVDTAAPMISIVTPTASSMASKKGGQQIYVNFTYVEANPENYTVQIRNSTAIINSITDTTTNSPVNISFTINAAAEGYYNVSVTMRDNASNTHTAIEVNALIIDTTPPTAPTNLIHTDDAPDGYDNDNSTDISWSASTDVSGVIYRIYNDGTFIDSTESKAYTFMNEIEGLHEYNVSAYDSAGNINTKNESVRVIVDYTDPVIHNVSLSDYTTSYGQQIVVSVNVTDINLASVTAGSTTLIHQSGMLWNGIITAGYGTNTVTVTAYDNASNSATNTSLTYTGPAPPTDDVRSSSSSSGGGGGGGGGSDEPENVEESIVLRLYLRSGESSKYDFNTVITSVDVTPKKTYGLVAAKIEVLKGRPGRITLKPPAGVIYKYVNIFIGNSGWSEGRFSDSIINFQVPVSWVEENNIDLSSIMMYRYYNGDWQPLRTSMTGQVGGYHQFSSPTPGFSTFLILGQVKEPVRAPAVAIDPVIVADTTPIPEATSTKKTPGFGILLGVMGVLITVYLRRR
jgi:PGF-pre-PGF domain-containing protein